MKYKLIVTDLDGTLLNVERIIPDKTRELINEFRKNGGIFTIATGRMEVSAKKYGDELCIDVPVILYNGAKVIDLNDGTIHFETKLDFNAAMIALKNLKNYPWHTLVYKDKKIYVSKQTDEISEYCIKDSVTCIEVDDLTKYVDSSPTKILIIGEAERFEEFVKISSDEFKRPINAIRSEASYLEILPDNVSKGTALEELCKILNIGLHETIAIGDHLNDLEMIKKAGFGVAVNNAHEQLKKNADYVTCKNDSEGAAEIIHMVLNNMI